VSARRAGIALRTTFIVGFPGETEAMFDSLLDFMRKRGSSGWGVHVLARGRHSRRRMAAQVPERTRQRRRERAMAVQHGIAQSVAASFVAAP